MKENQPKDFQAARDLTRREILSLSAGTAALSVFGEAQSLCAEPREGWKQGQLTPLIPTATHERFLIKASFKAPLTGTPLLSINGRPVEGVQTDPQGRVWRLDAISLQPATTYELRITDPGGAPLCDAWPLKTFPAPDATPEPMRILAYTCAGGYEGPPFERQQTCC
jgi:hypothetical protein